jgi:carbamoyl-phosphate synthase large subunit
MNPHQIKPKNVLVLGSGPIVIGQACEFDYSGTQACAALRQEGIRVVLLNSNPATIMTDPKVADRTYIESLDPMNVIEIIRMERIDAVLPTMGGQTALNLVTSLSTIPGALEGIQIIGANLKAIHLAEDRRAFREVVQSLGMESPQSDVVRSVDEAIQFANKTGFPFIVRPSFTLGGTGQSFIYSFEELVEKMNFALTESPIGEALVEESVLGWKEYELEVMRDYQDNAIIVCSIENLDPMGVHTGDSVTCAPAQTLTDREYQAMRKDALELIRRVGVETGGCNVQFAVNPKNGRRVVIEMNPRVSRSSALASKATGFPIAFVAAKLALGYALSEIQNPVTGTTVACFEPPIDYVAVKIPRWHFEKFPGALDLLGPQMQSVGEVLALGGSLGESFHKALTSLENKWPQTQGNELFLKANLKKAHSKRSYFIWDCLARDSFSLESMAELTGWDIWFLNEIKRYQIEHNLKDTADYVWHPQSTLLQTPRYEWVDTSSAEIKAKTPFFYSTRETLSEYSTQEKVEYSKKDFKSGKIVILGSGPNRIGQGVEFDYCCVHASQALQRLGFETIMVNCNPETVSTDPNISTKLYLEPLTEQSIKSVLERELKPWTGKISEGSFFGVLVQTGGQTPLKVAESIEKWNYNILGTSNDSIGLCEDRSRFAELLTILDIPFPKFSQASSFEEMKKAAEILGFPVLARPSFVLGGRAMRICSNESDLAIAFKEARQVSQEYPVYLDQFLSDAVEFDIDGICDGEKAWVAGVMEHVEEAGIHSGDSTCVIPPFRLPPNKIDEMAGLAKRIAVAAKVRGLFNIQVAVRNDRIYILEANPRASRTLPFLSKATGYPVIEWGLRAALGEKVSDIVKEVQIPGNYRLPSHGYAVKMPVFPFQKFKNFDPILGPEMRSTGEVMGIDKNLGAAFAKAFAGAGLHLPLKGKILVSVADSDKPRVLNIVRLFQYQGFEFVATPGTSDYLNRAGIVCETVAKIGTAPGEWVDLLSYLKNEKPAYVINTTGTLHSLKDSVTIRKAALSNKIPLLSTLSAAEMVSMAVQTLVKTGLRPVAIQDFVALTS